MKKTIGKIIEWVGVAVVALAMPFVMMAVFGVIFLIIYLVVYFLGVLSAHYPYGSP